MMPWIGDLNPNGMGIDIRHPAPRPLPGMPCPPVFGHQMQDSSVDIDQVMGADFSRRIAEPFRRRRAIRHSRVVEHNYVRRRNAAARPMIWGRMIANN